MALSIKIKNFEGPFDLLLHLIKKNEMNIYDINIYEITNQYLTYIRKMKELDLEVASEFIVMAATLLEIKSKLLLPKVKTEEAIGLDEQDAGKELMEKLLEYNKIKTAAEFLKNKQQGMMYSKKAEIIIDKQYDDKELFKNITIVNLYNIYSKLITDYNNKLNTENVMSRRIPIDLYKIEDKMLELENILNKKKNIYFSNIITDYGSKVEIVVTFLALLELIRLRHVTVVQQSNFKDIFIERINDYGTN